MRTMVDRAEDKRAWFDSFKDWLEGVAGFLDEKVSLSFSRSSIFTDFSKPLVSPT